MGTPPKSTTRFERPSRVGLNSSRKTRLLVFRYEISPIHSFRVTKEKGKGINGDSEPTEMTTSSKLIPAKTVIRGLRLEKAFESENNVGFEFGVCENLIFDIRHDFLSSVFFQLPPSHHRFSVFHCKGLNLCRSMDDIRVSYFPHVICCLIIVRCYVMGGMHIVG